MFNSFDKKTGTVTELSAELSGQLHTYLSFLCRLKDAFYVGGRSGRLGERIVSDLPRYHKKVISMISQAITPVDQLKIWEEGEFVYPLNRASIGLIVYHAHSSFSRRRQSIVQIGLNGRVSGSLGTSVQIHRQGCPSDGREYVRLQV
jgi:hypothetical protein